MKNNMFAAGLFAASAAFTNTAMADEPIVIHDRAGYIELISAFGATCVSNNPPDAKKCADAQISRTLEIAEKFESYLDSNKPGHERGPALASACERAFRAVIKSVPLSQIAKSPKESVPAFVTSAFSASSACLRVIDVIGKVVGVDFLPDQRRYLGKRADEGAVNIGHSI